MDAPPIQYARTEDGVNIAYWTLGEGPTLIVSQNFVLSHIELEWVAPELRAWYERLAERARVVRFCWRSTGLSDAGSGAYGLSACLSDLGAVIEAVRDDEVDVLAVHSSGPAAIAYTASNPGRVRRLVLFNAPADMTDSNTARIADAAHSLSHIGELGFTVRTMARYMTGGDDTEIEALVKIGTASLDTEAFRAMIEQQPTLRSGALLAQVEAETMVIHRREVPAPSLAASRRNAAEIPNAQLSVLEGAGLHPAYGDVEAVYRLVVGFLDYRVLRRRQAGDDGSPFRTILFTDVVASTPLLAQLKDAKMREVMRDHDAVLDAAVTEHGGRVVKEIGDAFMVEFGIPSAAVECAIAIQRGIRNQFAGSDVPIRLRIGINAGEPVVERDDLHGASVNIAKRLESAAPTNGILVSDVVKQAVVGKDFEFTDQGEVELKGFDDPVRAWSVAWE